MAGEGKTEVTNRLRVARVNAGLKQQELADMARISLRAITFIETDPSYVPSVGIALKLASALGCAVEDLFSLAGEGPALAWIDEQLSSLEAQREALLTARRRMEPS